MSCICSIEELFWGKGCTCGDMKRERQKKEGKLQESIDKLKSSATKVNRKKKIEVGDQVRLKLTDRFVNNFGLNNSQIKKLEGPWLVVKEIHDKSKFTSSSFIYDEERIQVFTDSWSDWYIPISFVCSVRGKW